MNKESLLNVLEGLSSSIDKENLELYKKLLDNSPLLQKGEIDDPEDFWYAVIYPFKNFVESVILEEISHNRDVLFIYTNHSLIERHFTKMFEKFEGPACSVDKARTMVKSLIAHFKTGQEIELNYSQEYTYHLPSTIFKTHDDIFAFYKALKSLFYGSPDLYLNELVKIKDLTKK